MASRARIEKFTPAELTALRYELMQSGLDSWQAADLISGFLAGRGYGSDTAQLRAVAPGLESRSSNLERMQEELEKVAFVM